MADKQAVLGNGAKFTGKITNAKSIEINGVVQADLVTEKVTIGNTGNFKGAVKSDLVVIAGEYEGKMKADSIWLTESSESVVKYIINLCRWIEVLPLTVV